MGKPPFMNPNVNDYWEFVETLRTPEGLPDWAFDFISVHENSDGSFNLISAMKLVEEKTGKRPDFEAKRFASQKKAIDEATKIAKKNNLHIVICK